MKNVFIWVKKDKFYGSKFRYNNNDEKILNCLKLQIHNSLDVGWKKEDVILATNFPFEYMGVKAHVIDYVLPWSATVNKIHFANILIKLNVIKDDFWLHDTDAFQLYPLNFPIKDKNKDIGFVRHSFHGKGKNILQGASLFFRKSAFDVIDFLDEKIIALKPTREERFLSKIFLSNNDNIDKLSSSEEDLNRCFVNSYKIARDNIEKYVDFKSGVIGAKAYESFKSMSFVLNNYLVKIGSISKKIGGKDKYSEIRGVFRDRFEWLDPTYNFSEYSDFSSRYSCSEKPIKVVHINLQDKKAMDCFYRGKNILNIPIVDERFRKIYKLYYDESSTENTDKIISNSNSVSLFDRFCLDSKIKEIVGSSKFGMSFSEMFNVFCNIEKNKPKIICDVGINATKYLLEMVRFLGNIKLYSSGLKENGIAEDGIIFDLNKVKGDTYGTRILHCNSDMVFLNSDSYDVTNSCIRSCVEKSVNFICQNISLKIYDKLRKKSDNFQNKNVKRSWDSYILKDVFGDFIIDKNKSRYDDDRVNVKLVRDKRGICIVEFKK